MVNKFENSIIIRLKIAAVKIYFWRIMLKLLKQNHFIIILYDL